MTTEKQPANSLPWTVGGHPGNDAGSDWRDILAPSSFGPLYVGEAIKEDAAYIVHACNAYPKLVEALRKVLSLRERSDEWWDRHGSETIELRALLRDLNETTTKEPA